MNVQFASFSKKKNSTAVPSSYAVTLDCQLKQPCSKLNPTLILTQSSFTTAYNYAYISAWGRNYFVSDATYLTGQRIEVSLTCDFLGTWRTSIGNYRAYVERCEDNDYFDVNVYDNYLSNTTKITNSSIATTALTNLDVQTGFYVLRTVAGHGASPSGIASYILTASELSSVISFMFSEDNFTDVITDESIKTFFNPFQYIVDIKWIPYDYDTYTASMGDKVPVYFGWWAASTTGYLMGLGFGGCRYYCNSINLPSNFYSDWRAYSNSFSQYNLFLPAVGTVSLSANELYEGICCVYNLDIITGEALCKLYSGSLTGGYNPSGVLISSYKTSMSVPIQLGQLAAQTTKTISGVASTIADVLSFNWGRAIETGVETAQTALQPTPSINGTTGDRYVLLTNGNITVSLNNAESCEFPSFTAGRPCFKNIVLSNLSGYVKCGNASVPLAGYEQDIEQVNNYLNNGFYME